MLNSIGNAEQTLNNQKYMEAAGLNPLPCFHYGEPIQYLKDYLGKYDYISLGGMVPIFNRDLIVWLDNLFSNYLTDSNGGPVCKVHGFGMTSLLLMLRYPWYSVDSTSWVLTSRFGSVYVPRKRQGKYVYDQNSWKVTVSRKSPSIQEEGKHITTFTEMERNQILEYFDLKGYKLGKSDVRIERKGYKLQEGERWFGKEEADSQRNIHGSDFRDGYVRMVGKK